MPDTKASKMVSTFTRYASRPIMKAKTRKAKLAPQHSWVTTEGAVAARASVQPVAGAIGRGGATESRPTCVVKEKAGEEVDTIR